MATTYTTAHTAGFGTSVWDHAVPVRDARSPRLVKDTRVDELQDSDQGYGPGHAQYRSLKSKIHSDYYNNHAPDSRTSPTLRSQSVGSGRNRSIQSGVDPSTVDDSAWIHRDKLAQIESKELQEIGLRVRRPASRSSRSRSRSTTASGGGRDDRRGRGSSQPASRSPSEAGMGPENFQSHQGFRGLGVPPIPAASENYARSTGGLVETNGFGFEDVPEPEYTLPDRSNSKSGISRIPVSRNSPAPLSSTFLERDSPLPRSRNGSLALNSSPEMPSSLKFSRPRSTSLGSGNILDDSNYTTRSRPTSMVMNNSPLIDEQSDFASSPRLKSPKPAPLNPKKGRDRAVSSTKSRNVSNSSPSARDSPSFRSKSAGRPIQTPQGEAPWIATMYKPDPMLPPDQQILPTHAKKMMQEQWAREGRTGDIYDKDFNLLNARDLPGPKPKLRKQVSFDSHLASSTPQGNNNNDDDDDEYFPRPWIPVEDDDDDDDDNKPVDRPGNTTTTTASSLSPDLNQASTPVANKRQSVYRLQTVGALPREDKVRQDAGAGPADIDSHGGLPQIQPTHHHAGGGDGGGDDGDDGDKDKDKPAAVHRKVDLDRLKREKKERKEELDEEKGAGCCKCVVM